MVIAPVGEDGNIVVYAEAGGSWKVLLSASNYEPLVLPRFLGGPGWLAAPGDYDGDGLADPAVTDPASGAWTVLLSTGGYRPQSLPGFLRAP